MSRVVILHSGGLDSTVCLLLAREKGHDVISLAVNYHQTHKIELIYAAKQCENFRVPHRVINAEWERKPKKMPFDRNPSEMPRAVSTAFAPGRNVVLFAIGCAQAAEIEASEVWAGINAVTYSGYPDCSAEFLEAFNRMIAIGMPSGPRVVAPLLQLGKPQIGSQARRLGLSRADTWSCYRPQLTSIGVSPCGRCDACILNELAWQEVSNASGYRSQAS